MKDYFCVKALDSGEMWVCIQTKEEQKIGSLFPLLSIVEDYHRYLSAEHITRIRQYGTYRLDEIPKPIADRLT